MGGQGAVGVRRKRTTRPQADLLLETEFFDSGARLVAGMDEVGRGALAGPVTVGVTVVGPETERCPAGLTDSKLLSAALRAEHEVTCRAWCLAWGVGHAWADEIDDVGLTAALRRAGLRALEQAQRVCGPIDALLLDGSHNWLRPSTPDLFSNSAEDDALGAVLSDAPVRTIVKGDQTCASISAASVLAKCERDRIMIELAGRHPHYGWDSNKGYGAASHLQALRMHGPTPVHRVSWRLPERITSPDGR